MKCLFGRYLLKIFTVGVFILPVAFSYGQAYDDPCAPTQGCNCDNGCTGGNGCTCGVGCNGDASCGTNCIDQDGGLLQLALGAGPYNHRYNTSYGFGLTEVSRQSGARGLLGLGGKANTYVPGYGYGGVTGQGYGTAAGQGGYGTGGGGANQGIGGQAGFAGAAALATASAVPDMIGDSTFASGGYVFSFGNSTSSWSVGTPGGSPGYPPIPLPAFHMSRLNMAEKFNALVQNRVYVDWRYFDGAGKLAFGADDPTSLEASNFTAGFERMVSRNASLELRVPVLHNLGSKQNLTSASTGLSNATELGNMSLVYKQILRRRQNVTYTGGLGLNTPTSRSSAYTVQDGNDIGTIKIANRIWRLTPYFGFQWHPNRRVFGHFLTQIDVPLSQARVTAGYYDGINGYWENASGKFYDQTLLRVNSSIGRWFYRNEGASVLTGAGAMFEVHYTQAMNSACGRNVDTWQTGSNGWAEVTAASAHSRSNVVNMVGAIPLEFGKTIMMNAVTFPVTDQQNFQLEYNLAMTRRF